MGASIVSRISHLDLQQAAKSYAGQILAKCKAEKIEAGVLVVIIPKDDPQPSWATNLTMQGLRELTRKLDTEAAVRGLIVAPSPTA
jgi:hypothetical protein